LSGLFRWRAERRGGTASSKPAADAEQGIENGFVVV
jgi:hypothetical protein